MGWTAGTTRGGVGHLGLTRTETQRGRWWTTGGPRCMQQKRSNDPRNNQHNPRYANYWAPLTHKRHPPQPAQPRYTNGAPRTWKRHQQEHWPQRPTERSNRTPHAEGRAGDCPGPRKKAATAGTGHGCRLAVTRRRLKPQPPWARRQRRRPADRRWAHPATTAVQHSSVCLHWCVSTHPWPACA